MVLVDKLSIIILILTKNRFLWLNMMLLKNQLQKQKLFSQLLYHRNFYMAEGALIEAIDILANSTDLAANPPDWYEPDAGNLTEANVVAYWDTVAQESSVDDTGNTRFVAGVEGYGAGGSLDVDKPTVKSIGVYGRCQRNGVTMIKVGYLKVY